MGCADDQIVEVWREDTDHMTYEYSGSSLPERDNSLDSNTFT